MSHVDLIATCWTTAGDAVPLGGKDDSPVPLPERIAAASNAGFTGFGIVHNDLRNFLQTSDLPTLRKQLDDSGMTYVELEFVTGWWAEEGPERAASDATVDLLLRACQELQPYHVKAGPDIANTAYDMDLYARNFYRISEAFSQVGTKISLEFMPFSNVNTLARAVELVQTAGHPAGGLMVDLWHLMRGAGTLDELAAVPLQCITGVELDDGDAEQVDDGYSDTVLRRRLCGQGSFPVVEAINVLRRIGWDGPWGVEIISETYRKRPVQEAVAEAFVTTAACFDRADSPR